MKKSITQLCRWRVRAVLCLLVLAVVLAGTGCDQFWINSADDIASKIIRHRQKQTLGTTSDSDIGAEDGRVGSRGDMYSFTPSRVDSKVPDSFRRPARNEIEDEAISTNGFGDAIPFRLSDALEYAFHNAWDFQTQKEDLYLSALALMTERQLWTPQFVAGVRGEYANYGQVRDFDHAMTAVSELSVTQRLPYGGEVAARVVNVLMRDIGRHTTSGESGTAILEANIPLLRGAGKVAYESRFQAERNLVYAVRDFEAARRDLVVDVAGDFFDLLAIKTQIESAEAARESAMLEQDRTQAWVDTGRLVQIEAKRIDVQVLDRSNDVNNARVRYETALDRFKIRIGMPTQEHIDVVDEELDLFEPDVTEHQAVETAIAYRLDLINTMDRIDDAKRGVVIAKNNFLPQFDISGSITTNTDPNKKNSLSYNTERTLWQGMVELEVPLDRREERNVFRAALIDLRRGERAYELAKSNVILDVRSAIRNLQLAKQSMAIQEENIEVNEERAAQANELLKRGRLSSSRDTIEAQNAIQASKNQYAAAVADYRLAILTLQRSCGTLRVDDQGHWTR
ncbi:MAG: TolC family protein [Phycisphaerales bacterium]|nr:TolC family protein [Phycisphaerales bacterium]